MSVTVLFVSSILLLSLLILVSKPKILHDLPYDLWGEIRWKCIQFSKLPESYPKEKYCKNLVWLHTAIASVLLEKFQLVEHRTNSHFWLSSLVSSYAVLTVGRVSLRDGFFSEAAFRVLIQFLCPGVKKKPAPSAPSSYCCLRRLKLSMMTPIKRFKMKNAPSRMNTTKYIWLK